MSEQVQRDASKKAEPEQTEDTVTAKDQAELTEETDDLLDEIDSVLESNAEQFVQDYVQRGGQ